MRAAVGVSIFVNNTAPHSYIPLNTNLQAVAVSVTLHRVITLCSIYIPPSSIRGWSGGAKVLGKLPVPGRPTIWITLGQAYCACSRCGWGLFGHFYSHLSFLFSFSLSLAVKPKTTNQPSSILSPKDLDDLAPQLPSPFILGRLQWS